MMIILSALCFALSYTEKQLSKIWLGNMLLFWTFFCSEYLMCLKIVWSF
jgi:hypothetical protein